MSTQAFTFLPPKAQACLSQPSTPALFAYRAWHDVSAAPVATHGRRRPSAVTNASSALTHVMHGDAVTDTATAHTGIRSPAPRRSSALAAHTHSLATVCPGRCSPPPREHGQGHAFFLVNHLDTDTALHSAAPNLGDAVAGTCGRRGLAAAAVSTSPHTPGPTHAHRTSTAWPP